MCRFIGFAVGLHLPHKKSTLNMESGNVIVVVAYITERLVQDWIDVFVWSYIDRLADRGGRTV
jgi:hypothetical protein